MGSWSQENPADVSLSVILGVTIVSWIKYRVLVLVLVDVLLLGLVHAFVRVLTLVYFHVHVLGK